LLPARVLTSNSASPRLGTHDFACRNRDRRSAAHRRPACRQPPHAYCDTPPHSPIRVSGHNFSFTLTKLNININKAIQDKRGETQSEEHEKDKIIDLDRNAILKHLNSLSDIKDKLVFAVHTLQLSRRLDWPEVALTRETDEKVHQKGKE
jgi:hypothetical protein